MCLLYMEFSRIISIVKHARHLFICVISCVLITSKKHKYSVQDNYITEVFKCSLVFLC